MWLHAFVDGKIIVIIFYVDQSLCSGHHLNVFRGFNHNRAPQSDIDISQFV